MLRGAPLFILISFLASLWFLLNWPIKRQEMWETEWSPRTLHPDSAYQGVSVSVPSVAGTTFIPVEIKTFPHLHKLFLHVGMRFIFELNETVILWALVPLLLPGWTPTGTTVLYGIKEFVPVWKSSFNHALHFLPLISQLKRKPSESFQKVCNELAKTSRNLRQKATAPHTGLQVVNYVYTRALFLIFHPSARVFEMCAYVFRIS